MKLVPDLLASCAALVASALLVAPARVHAAAEEPALLFSISKTENRNYVQFAERLAPDCSPATSAPVFAYWRMLERGPSAVEPLLPHEQPAYGIASQALVARNDGWGMVAVTLRALPRSALLVESRRGANGGCEALARMPIEGTEARLANVHAVLRWPFGIARLLVSGWSLADGRPLKETRAL